MQEPEPMMVVSIPADIEVEDRVLAGLTARQVAILAGAGVLVWLAYLTTLPVLPLPVFAAIAIPFGAGAAVLALGRRDGVGLDRLLLAAIRQARSPSRLVPAPDGVRSPPGWVNGERARPLPAPLRLPARALRADGVIDLGTDGMAVICAASTVSFALRTPHEQTALVGVFGRWLNSLSGPVQVVVRADDVDIAPLINGLLEQTRTLPVPELEQAAIEHACFLADLAERQDLLRRQVLIVLREPRHGTTSGLGRRGARDGDAVAQRVLRRADETVRALAAAGIAVQVLPSSRAAAVLAACCNPWQSAPSASMAERAAPTDVITAGGSTWAP